VKRFGLLAVAAALALVATADAREVGKSLTADGQAAARGAILTASDMGDGWKKQRPKAKKTSSGNPCPAVKLSSAGLVTIGEAESSFKQEGVTVDSAATVLRTPRMVELDWQRGVLSSKVLRCLRASFAKASTAKVRFHAMRQVPFPAIANSVSRAYRALFFVKTAGGAVPVYTDVVFVGRGSTEITLTVTMLATAVEAIAPNEQVWARMLASRARL
jgi:hypothetical protein